ncbi:MAG TPA: methyltransferase domain-containing protein [Lachnospiraceae bacterium]|nr:methyltransferase domain-containing protein [Lachnospiraceae bacterium]
MNKEKMDAIGNVVINYSYYSGEDVYSEGISEDILLDLVQRYRESEFEHVIQNSRSWSVMYHLSYIRENIVSWLPIEKTAKVLEIGSGCGAITGKLAEMAEKVTCIELSKKRSLINATRHKEYDNIEIIVGNFMDIEKEITETYDYITLIGVLEYAESYIGGTDPYRGLLRLIGKHLAPGGKIVVAIENRFGLKYFAGCKEDHTGGYFDGIEGYPNSQGVKTFSKEKLALIMEEAGFSAKFYYPYPDYKLPHTIYSDEYLPKAGELTTNLRNFDADRVVSFDESKVFDSLIEEGLFSHYSNSFLVLASAEDIWDISPVIPVFAKYANDRSVQFRVATMIMQDKTGNKFVYKAALNTKTNPHISAIYSNYQTLTGIYEGTKLKPNICKFIQGVEAAPPIAGVSSKAKHKVELTYLRGITLEKYLDMLEAYSDYDKMLALIREYQALIAQVGGQGVFTMTEEFKEIFGECRFEKEYAASFICNYDMIFSNIVLDETTKENGEWNVLDYEWLFKFPIPFQFIVYRSLYYYFENRGSSGFLTYLDEKGTDIYKECGIDEKEQELFAEMEHRFQVYIISGVASLEVMQVMMPSTTINLGRLLVLGSYLRNLNTPKIYFSCGEGFFTENQIHVLANVTEGRLVTMEIPLAHNMVGLRIDPTEYPCVVHINKVELTCLDGSIEDITRYLINGYAISEDTLLFDTDDAQIILEKIPHGARKLCVEYQVTMFTWIFFNEIRDMLIRKRECERVKPTILDRILIKCRMKKWEELPEGFSYNKESEEKE